MIRVLIFPSAKNETKSHLKVLKAKTKIFPRLAKMSSKEPIIFNRLQFY